MFHCPIETAQTKQNADFSRNVTDNQQRYERDAIRVRRRLGRGCEAPTDRVLALALLAEN